ncbi:MAG: putative oxidoreductase [Fimbriimonadaceae bacterium]|nr:putative oxidoreductase [Fimbriimonadaceae bacterium]
MAAKTDKLLDIGLLILRIGLGLVVLYYGLQKGFGAFNGNGFQGQLDVWEAQRHIPKWLGVLAIISEFAGSIGVIFGLFTRIAAFGIACSMATAAFLGASRAGALAGLWDGDKMVPPTVLYPLALAFMAAALVFTGAGAFSLDRKVFKRGK